LSLGRHHLDALPIIAGIGCPIYLVTSNGQGFILPKELLFSLDSNEVIKSVLSLKIDAEFTTVVFKENVWLTNKDNESLNSFQAELLLQVVDFDTVKDLSAIKCFTHERHSKLIELRDRILVHSNDFSHAFSLPLCLEFMDKTVDKNSCCAHP
jgi:hydroxymethylpyrimidine pyrophosphatase-like HAD family hydrolase